MRLPRLQSKRARQVTRTMHCDECQKDAVDDKVVSRRRCTGASPEVVFHEECANCGFKRHRVDEEISTSEPPRSRKSRYEACDCQ